MTTEGNYVPSTADWVAEQVERYEASGGREANTLRDTGIPIVVVTMRGGKTGHVRKVPLMRVTHDGEYALVASYGGRPSHPVWYHNLRADPTVAIQDGDTPRSYRVRELAGDERELWWQRSVAVYPPYAEYQVRATDRVIPVLLATPV